MSIRRNAGGAPPALPPPNSKISGSSSRLAAAPDAEEDDMYMTMSAVPTRLATQPPTLPPRELTSSPTLSSSSSVSINSMGSTGGPSSQAAAAAAAAVSGSASSLPGSPLAAASSPIATATAAAATVADTPAKENGTAADKAGLPQVDVDEAPSQPPATKQASGLQRAPSSVVQPREATPGSFRVLTPASVSVTLKGHTQRLVAFTKHLQEFIHQIAFLQRHQAAQMKALSSQFKRKYDEKFQAFSTHAPQLDKLWQVAELSCSASADTLEFGAGDLLNVSESLQAFFVHNETLHNTILVNRRNAESALANEETSVKNVQRMYKEASERAEKAEKDDKKLIKLGPNKDKLLASRDLLHNEYVAHLAATRRHFEMYHTMALPQTLDAMEALHTILEFRAKDSLSAYAAITQKRQFELIAGFDELVERAEAYDAVRENEQFVASFGAIETGDVPVLSFVPFGEDDKEHILLSKFTADEIASRKIKLQDTISQTESDITKKTAAIQDKRHQKRELILKSKDSEAANLEVEVLAMQTELNNLKITHAKAQAQFTVYSSLDFSAVLRTPPQTRASMAQLPISTTSPAAAAGASPADAKPQLPQRNSSVLNSPASSRVAPGTVDAHETADGAAALGNARHKSFGSASGLSSLSNNSRASSSTSISQEESASASKDEYLDVDTLSPSAAAGQRKLPARPSNLPPIASGAATGGAPTSIPSRPQLPPLRTNSTVSPAAVKPAVRSCKQF
ncbi:hypothetical protein CAOG_02368 [Capsaspora owczarzaki ATCC 30864]|uniref:hypothetical protein n=1 Tax=Capsaspora owczarzaki (strain ATCC 30864) TaxID=595528 RepID=UPI0001FE44F8|nr:hypothetical protein CAOG_02368 [Capsaspora owczarzaki ATCC 30864]|eukprot:XP_004349118.1 hypothetical protein CAOG_02368 [Capsaspora owczarzaki ATCC 30864]